MAFVDFDDQDGGNGFVDFDAPEKRQEKPSSIRRVADIGISAVKSAIGVPEAAVGLADIVTGGRAGKLAEEAGFRPRQAKAFLDEYLSPQQQEANKRVADAEGFVDTAAAAIQNPSVIGHTALESLASMGAGGLVGRGIAGVSKAAPWIAGAIGEGVVGAGSSAERIRQQSKDGELSAVQAGAALATGAGTALFGAAGGRVAQKLGIADVDTMLAAGGKGLTSKGVARRMAEGGIAEGVFEELPQSVQEQVWQNAALGKDLMEGVPESAAMGLLTGAAMGGGASALINGKPASPVVEPSPETEVPPAGPIDYEATPVPPSSPLTLATEPQPIGNEIEFTPSIPLEEVLSARLEEQIAGAVTNIATADSVDGAILAAQQAAAVPTPSEQLLKQTQNEQAYAVLQLEQAQERQQQFEIAEQARRDADVALMVEQQRVQQVEQANAPTQAQGFGDAEPSAMQLAMQRAKGKSDASKQQEDDVRNKALADELASLIDSELQDVIVRRDVISKEQEFAGMLKSEQSDLAYLRQQSLESQKRTREFALAEQARRDAAIPAMERQRGEQEVDTAQAVTRAQGFDDPQQTALQVAMQAAQDRRKRMLTPVSKRAAIVEPASAPQATEPLQQEAINETTALPASFVPISDDGVGGVGKIAKEQPVQTQGLTAVQSPIESGPAATAAPIPAVRTGIPSADGPVGESSALARPAKFAAPHDARIQRHFEKADKEGIPREFAEKLLPEESLDAVTGYQRAEEKVPTVQRAQKYTEETGKTAHYVDADLANLGGLNSHFNNDNAKANKEYRAIADIFADEMGRAGESAVLIRTGGDEIGAVVIGGTSKSVDAAMQRAQERVKAHAATQGYGDIPHSKYKDDLNRRGVGLYLGQAAIKSGKSLDTIFSEASAGLDAGKKGFENVTGIKSGEAGADASAGRRGSVSKGGAGVTRQADGAGRSGAPSVSDAEASADTGPATARVSAKDSVAQAKVVLNRAAVSGKDRLDLLDRVKSGALSVDDLSEAFPSKENQKTDDQNEQTGGIPPSDERPQSDKKSTPASAGQTDTSPAVPPVESEKSSSPPKDSNDTRKSVARAPSGITVAAVTKSITRLRAKWLGSVKVNTVQSIADLPDDIAERANADDKTDGFYDPQTKTAYLIADNIVSSERATWVAIHEVVGHGGLRMLKDKSVNEALNLAGANRFVRDLAQEIQKDRGDLSEVISIEEAIAELAAAIETNDFQALTYRYGVTVPAASQNGLRGTVARILEAVRRFIGAVMGKPAADVSDADVRNMISRQRDAVEGKQSTESESGGDVLASTKAGYTATVAFRDWFGDSKVVDDDGKPLVVYHGTGSDFNVFDYSKIGEQGRAEGAGFYFTDNKSVASGYGKPIEVYLSIKKPLPYGEKPFKKPVLSEILKRIAELESKTDDTEIADGFLSNFGDIRYDGFNKVLKEAVDSISNDKTALDQISGLVGAGVNVKTINLAVREITGYDGVIAAGFSNSGGGDNNIYVAFFPEQIKSATDNNGQFDASNPDIRYSKSVRTQTEWFAPDQTRLDDFIYMMQDKQVDTKRVVQAITKVSGNIADEFDPRLQETLFSGRSAKATHDFAVKELKPLYVEMQARGVTMDDLEEFLHARHAKERNTQIASINPKMQDGGSGMKTADADTYLASLSQAKRKAYEALAKRVDSINAETQKLLVESGLEKQSTIDAWNAAYKHYVPLQRAEVAEGTQGIGQGFSVKGASTRRAMGSNKEVIDILANIAMQRERTILRAEKNRVATATYGLAIDQPNKDFWLAVNPTNNDRMTPKQYQEMEFELIALGLDPADAANIMKEPKQRFVDPRTGLVAERINPALRSAQNVMALRVNGEDRFIFFSEKDPRAQRMAVALKNLDADQLGIVLGAAAKVSRWFAAVNTQYNPVFGIVNVTRDVQGALMNLSTTPIAGKQKAVLANTASALRGIYSDIRATRGGRAPISQWARLYEEFQEEGGQTGFRDIFADSGERAKALQSEINQITEGKIKSAGRAIFGWLSDYNETLENAVRLAAYKVGTDQGMSKQRAAAMAKELTVNFNRKGTVALQAGALYAFFNASVQGTTRLAETLSGPAGKKIVAGGLVLGAMQALMFAAAGFDDGEPPEFVKERSLILPTFGIGGDGKYLALPMPLGFHVIPSFSRIVTEWAMSGGKNTAKRTADIFGLFASSFNPIGSAGFSIQTIAPTAADPFVALSENRDFTGKPIAREDLSGLKQTPGYTRAKDTASWFSEKLSYYLNLASGGTQYQSGVFSPTPDQIDYLFGQVTGGVGREGMKVEQAIITAFTGEDLAPNKVPLLGRFYGDTEGKSAESGKFYNNLKRMNGHKLEIDGRRKNRENVTEYLRDNPDAMLVAAAMRTQNDVGDLNKLKRKLMEKDVSKERIKLIEIQIAAKMKRLNDRIESVREE